MLEDVFDQQQQLRIDDISSSISAQIFDFCDPYLFSETLQNSEVTSCSIGCYEDNNSSLPSEINNSYQDNNNNANKKTHCNCITISENISCGCPKTNSNTPITTASAVAAKSNNNNSNNLSIIFDSQDDNDNDISASIDFSPSPPFSVPQFLPAQQFQFDFSSSMQLPNPIPSSDAVNVDGLSVSHYTTESINPRLGSSVFDKDCISSVPSYAPINPSSPSCSFLGRYMPVSGTMTATLSADGTGIFSGSILTGSELQLQEPDFQVDNSGIFCPDSLQRVFSPGDLQALSGESPQMMGGAANSTPIASEISSLEDSNFKVGKLSVEQRKEKIHRYLKKRNERNFSKKIKYACRKTLADSRPRVRGRFAKNDDFGETIRTTCTTHDEDDYDEAVAKEENEMVDSSDIFGRISVVNSFKFNYPIQSWI